MSQSLGPLLKSVRANASISRDEAAARARGVYGRIVGTEEGSGIDGGSVGFWEREDRCPSLVQAQCLMEAIGMSPADVARAVPMLADLEARIRSGRTSSLGDSAPAVA